MTKAKKGLFGKESPDFSPVVTIRIRIRIRKWLIPAIRHYSIFDYSADFHYSYITSLNSENRGGLNSESVDHCCQLGNLNNVVLIWRS